MYTLHFEGRRAHFLAMPRTGSKACRDALKALGGVTFDEHHSITMYDDVVQKGDLVISTVRNHWDWFASFWELNQRPGKFNRFVPKLCEESQWIDRNPTCNECRLFWEYTPLSTHILRYERLDLDLNEVLTGHGFPAVTLKQTGKKKPRPYQIYYKVRTREYIRELFKDEIKHYGYRF